MKAISEKKDFYKILQVDNSADSEVIKAAYKKLTAKFHPDKNKFPDSTHLMQDINEAYAVLSDPAKRAQYDNELRQRSVKPAVIKSPDKKSPFKLMKISVILCFIIVSSFFIYKKITSRSTFISPGKNHHQVIVSCVGKNEACDKNGMVKIWADENQKKASSAISAQSLCTASKLTTNNDGKKMWLIDCSSSQSGVLKTVKGWVSNENLIFTSRNN